MAINKKITISQHIIMNTKPFFKAHSKLILGVLVGATVGVNSPILASNVTLLSTTKSYAYGQTVLNKTVKDVTVKGRVIDAKTKEPLAGCNILVKDSKRGVNADANGNFSITADEKATLVFSFVGYEKQEIAIAGKSTIEVALVSSASDLEQVVVVGYGSSTKKDITGSVKSLKSAEFNQGIINSPEQLLQGKVSGVNVTSASGEPGGVQNISVRGPGGVRTGSTPLFVVDGLALDNSSSGGATNPLTFLNPQDIESIDVLKDASATAIYGSAPSKRYAGRRLT